MEFKRINLALCVLVSIVVLVTVCEAKSTRREKMKGLMGITGIDILRNQMNIRRIKATFNFKEVS